MGMTEVNHQMLASGRAYLESCYKGATFPDNFTAEVQGKRIALKTSMELDLVFKPKLDGPGWGKLSDVDLVFAVMLERKKEPRHGVRFYLLDARKVEAQMDAVRAERPLPEGSPYICFITDTGDGSADRKHRFGLHRHGKLLARGKL